MKIQAKNLAFFHNIIWLYSESLLRLVLGFFVSVWMAKYLGVTNFGKFSYAISINSILGVIGLLGLKNVIIKELLHNQHEKEEIISTGSRLIFYVSGTVYLIFFVFFMIFEKNDYVTKILVLLVNVNLFTQFNVLYEYYCDSSLSAKKYIKIKNIVNLTSIGIKLVFLYFNFHIFWFATTYFLESLLILGGYYFIGRKENFSYFNYPLNKQIATKILKLSFPLILSGLSVQIFVDIDQIMLKKMVGDAANGSYAFAVRLSNIFMFLPSAFIGSSYPQIINAMKINTEEMYEKINHLFKTVTFICYTIALFFFIFSDKIISNIASPEYSSSAAYLKILAWTGVFAALGGARTLILVNLGYTMFYLYSVVFSCILNIVLNYIFIPQYGPYAACVNTLITTFFASIGSCFFYFPTYRIGIAQIKALIYPKFW